MLTLRALLRTWLACACGLTFAAASGGNPIRINAPVALMPFRNLRRSICISYLLTLGPSPAFEAEAAAAGATALC